MKKAGAERPGKSRSSQVGSSAASVGAFPLPNLLRTRNVNIGADSGLHANKQTEGHRWPFSHTRLYMEGGDPLSFPATDW
jgi:hypothetical protein